MTLAKWMAAVDKAAKSSKRKRAVTNGAKPSGEARSLLLTLDTLQMLQRVPMTLDQLRDVHGALDLLFAQYILAHPGRLMRELTVFNLAEWNAKRITDAESGA